jgi:hypothetical protein
LTTNNYRFSEIVVKSRGENHKSRGFAINCGHTVRKTLKIATKTVLGAVFVALMTTKTRDYAVIVVGAILVAYEDKKRGCRIRQPLPFCDMKITS